MTENSAEVHFAQRLASNEKKIRDRSIRKLRKWLSVRCQQKQGLDNAFTEEDFLKIWKGLHYCMWMQDKTIIQEELAASIAQLVHVFKDPSIAMKFVDTFFQTEAREWNGIDRWRLDKFMLFVRCVLGQTLKLLMKLKWQKKYIRAFTDIISNQVLNEGSTDGLKIHVTDIYLDELEKVGAEVLTADQVILFLEPFTQFIQKSKNTVLVQRVISRIFNAIIDQSVNDAMEAATKQLEEEGDQDVDEMLEDMDIDMPPRLENTTFPVLSDERFLSIIKNWMKERQKEFDFQKIADHLFEAGKDEHCVGRNRTLIYACVKKFRDLEQGILPESKEEIFDPKKGYIDRKEFAIAVSQLEALQTVKRKKKKRKRRKGAASGEEAEAKDEEESGEPEVKKRKETKGISEGKKGGKVTEKENINPPKRKERKKAEKEKSDSEEAEASKTPSKQGEEKTTKKIKKKKGGTASISEDQLMAVGSTRKTSTSRRTEEIPSDGFHSGDSDASPGDKQKRKRKVGQDSDFDTVEFEDSGVPEHRVGLDTLALKHLLDKDSETQTLNSKGVKNAHKNVLNDDKRGEKEVKKKGKKGKHSSGEDNVESESLLANVSSDTSDYGLQEDELKDVEIWIPNKKYHGKLKGKFEEAKRKAEESSPMKRSPKTRAEKASESFAHFETLKKTPPAFVRKAVSKVTPKPVQRKSISEALNTPQSAGSEKKKVIFNMKKNQARDFKESIQFSPDPFNPMSKPDHSILKTPETTRTPNLRSSAAKKTPKTSRMPMSAKRKSGPRGK